MHNFQIDLDNELGDGIVADILIKQRQDWIDELGKDDRWGTFNWDDVEENDKELRQHIQAIETIIKWFATPSKLKEIGLG